MSLYGIVKKILWKVGVMKIVKNKLRKMGIIPETFASILLNLKHRGISVNTIIDIGASDGRWSDSILTVFPESHFFLIEANDIHRSHLEGFKKKNKNVEYIIAAAGDEVGNIYFDNTDPFGGLATHEKTNEDLIEVPVVTVDHCACNGKLVGPFLLKLDTHGFELPIFKGASKVLEDTNIIVVEAYNFRLTRDTLLFYEMCEYMMKKGFRCSGLIEPGCRPKDGFLWQMDLIFVRETRKEFTDNNYK
jgi:FkbM family methyltransferase